MESLDHTPSVSEAYPESGTKAYSVVLGAWLALFPASGLLNSTGIFQAWLLDNQLRNHSEGEIGWIFSTFAFLFFFGGFQVGPIFDRYGLGLLLPTGAVGLTVSLICTSFCTSYYQFMLAFGCLGGLASSILWTSSIATLGHWFHQNRGLATGLATTAGGFGGVCYPLMFTQLVRQIGFAWTIRCFAMISVICFACSQMLLKTRLPTDPKASLHLDWRGFKDMRFTLTMAAIFILDWAVLVPPAYITTYASAKGLGGMSRYILATLNAASIFGRFLPGPVADRAGRFNVMILCSALCSVSIFGLWLNAGSSGAILLSFAVLYGFFSGSAYSLTPVCVAQLCRTENYATRYGTAYGVVSLATLAGIPVSGNILGSGAGNGDGKKNYSALILFCGAAYAMSTALFVLARGILWEEAKELAVFKTGQYATLIFDAFANSNGLKANAWKYYQFRLAHIQEPVGRDIEARTARHIIISRSGHNPLVVRPLYEPWRHAGAECTELQNSSMARTMSSWEAKGQYSDCAPSQDGRTKKAPLN